MGIGSVVIDINVKSIVKVCPLKVTPSTAVWPADSTIFLATTV